MHPMYACLDASYREDKTAAACVLFRDWRDDRSAGELTAFVDGVSPYIPGRFYLRELPALLAVLDKLAVPVEIFVVDGFVWLDTKGSPGLGAHLYEAVGSEMPVIGVAKSRFRSAPAVEVKRGRGRRPLFISAAGIHVRQAAECIRNMHGPHRLPTLLRRADELSRRMEIPDRHLDIPSADVL